MLCECGCGKDAGFYKNGKMTDKPKRFCHGHGYRQGRPRPKNTHCKYGHLISEVGRTANGDCNACSRIRANAYTKEHPEMSRVRTKRWKALNPEKVKDGMRQRVYKLTPEQYRHLLEEQEHKCKVCRKLFTEQKMDIPCIDHNHLCCSGKESCGKCVRGVICYRCNVVLGFVNDAPEVLKQAIQYLKETQIGK